MAGDKLELLAANDSNYYLYDKKSKGSFGSKKTRRDEITDVTAVGSQISSGGDLTLLSGGDQTYQGAKLESGNDLAIVSGGAVTFDAVKDLHQESHEKSKGDLAWQSSKGKGQTDETVRQSQLVAQGNLAIKAVEGLKIDLKHIDQKTVSQTIEPTGTRPCSSRCRSASPAGAPVTSTTPRDGKLAKRLLKIEASHGGI